MENLRTAILTGLLIIIVSSGLGMAIPEFSATTTNITGAESFEISNLSTPNNATQGDTITVTATITNTGNATVNGTIDYQFNGTIRSNTTVELSPDNETTVEFKFNTTDISAGNYTHGVFSANDNKTAEIEIIVAEKSGSGPETGPPPADMASWKNTKPLPGNQATPASLGGKLRVEEQFKDNTTVELIKNTSGNYTLSITITGNATNVTFFLQEDAVTSSQNISNVTMYLDGQEHVYYDEAAGPGNSPWILFEIGHFSTRTVSFTSESQTTPTIATYAGSDGIVQSGEVISSFSDWQDGTIDTSLLIEIFTTWQSGQPVT